MASHLPDNHLAEPPAPSHLSLLPPGPGRARRDDLVRSLATGALWVSLVLVTWWWIRDGALNNLATPSGFLTEAGRWTGLVASVLLLAQVVLMARVPVLEAAYGQDRLARIHRIVGLTSFTLLVGHLVLITWGYAGGQVAPIPGTLWNLVLTYPGMLLALAGTAALVLVVATSLRAARRRLRYESWHLLHLYAYLGAGLALPHQLWTGAQFTASPARTVFWWGAWIAAAATIVCWRVVTPLWRSLRHDLRVSRVVHEQPGVVSVYLSGRDLHRLPVDAGQFFTWRFLGRRGWTRANPYSLSAAPRAGSLRITARTAGDGGSALPTLKPGSRVLFEGPYGRLSPRARTRHRIVLVGAGVGITPLRALAEGLPYRRGEATLLHRYTDSPLFHEEWAGLVRDRGLEVIELPGHRRHADSWLGNSHLSGDDAQVLRTLVPDLPTSDVYVCGPSAWSDAVVRACTEAGLPPGQLHVESFRW